MGRTVAELNESLSLEELDEWQAYSLVEPFGSPADDDRWRQNYTLTFAVNAPAGTEQPDWLDRIPSETERARAKITIDDKMEAFFDSMVTVKTDTQVIIPNA